MKFNLLKNFLLFQRRTDTLIRHCSKKKYDVPVDDLIKPVGFYALARPWRETAEIKRHVRKRKKIFHMEMSLLEIQAFLTGMNSFPISPEEFQVWFAKKREEKEIFEQEFIPERVTLLRSDLAAAHFIVHRGGAIRFYGDPRWVGKGRDVEGLPDHYVPGLYVEYIDAVGTRLQYEGLMNLLKLRRLKWLCLSGLEKLDNFALDLLSSEYGNQLSYLDISHCRGIDYNGLSCMYRFEKLRTFDVTGISGHPDFKMACNMLEELNPKLEILGVDYSIPVEKYKLETTQKLFK